MILTAGTESYGVDTSVRLNVTESFASMIPEIVTSAAVVESEYVSVSVDSIEVPSVTATVRPETVADEGTTERTPRPNAATATSAMRL